MAFETVSTISVVLSQLFSAQLADQRNMDAVELERIRLVPNDSGKNISWGAKFSGSKASTVFAYGSDVQDAEFTKTDKVPALLNFGAYRSPAKIDDLAAMLAQVSTGSPAEVRGLVDGEITDSLVQITKDIATDFHVGTGTNGGNPNIVGIHGGAALNTGSYAGISRVDYAEWKGQVIGNGAVDRPLTDDLLRQAEQACFLGGGEPPDTIITTAAIHRKYGGLFSSIQRVQTPGPQAPTLGMGTLDLFWNNMPVVRSARAPSKKLVMFNSRNVEFVFPEQLKPIASVPMNPLIERMGLDLKRQYILPILVQPLAQTGNNIRFNVFTYVQLRVRRPNAVAIIQDISES
jgi:hypothetical protein